MSDQVPKNLKISGTIARNLQPSSKKRKAIENKERDFEYENIAHDKKQQPTTSDVQQQQQSSSTSNIPDDNIDKQQKVRKQRGTIRKHPSWGYYFVESTGDPDVYHCLFEGSHGKFKTIRSKTTQGILDHMRHHHLQTTSMAQNRYEVGEEIDELAKQILEEANKQEKKQQLEITQFVKKISNKEQLITRWLDWLVIGIQSGIPFNALGSCAMRKHLLEHSGKVYPNRNDLSGFLLTGLYRLVRLTVQRIIKQVEAVNITCDGWSGTLLNYFVAVTCHFIDSNWTLQRALLGFLRLPGSKDADLVAKCVENIYNGVLPKESIVSHIVSDSGANYKRAANLLLKHQACMAHKLQIVIKHSIGAVSEVLQILDKTRRIVVSIKTTQNLRDQMNFTGFTYDVETRWNSGLEMLRDFQKKCGEYERIYKQMDDVEFQFPNMKLMADIVTILLPFEIATTTLGSESNITASKVPRIIAELKKALQVDFSDSQCIGNFKIQLSKHLEKELGWILTQIDRENTFLHAACLDPYETKQLSLNPNQIASLWKVVEEEIWDFTPESGLSSDEKEGLRLILKGQVAMLKGEFLKIEDPPHDPLTWWKSQKNQVSYHLICPYVRMMLSNMATSTPSERVFKASSHLYGDDQGALGEETLEKMVFIRQNMHLLPKDFIVEVAIDLAQDLQDDDVMGIDPVE